MTLSDQVLNGFAVSEMSVERTANFFSALRGDRNKESQLERAAKHFQKKPKTFRTAVLRKVAETPFA